MIYLDNAATTLHKPEGVAEAMTMALTSMGNSGRGAKNLKEKQKECNDTGRRHTDNSGKE